MHRLIPLLVLVPALAVAQGNTTRVVVTDSLGNRVAFAYVQPRSGQARTADDSGRVDLAVAEADSIQLTVRRIGYAPFEGKAGRDATLGAHRVMLAPLPQTLERMSILAPRENRLYRNGFYEREQQSYQVATTARFFGPEALDTRNASRVSQLLGEVSFLRVGREGPKPYVQGRGRCAVSIVMDGKRLTGTIEELGTPEGEYEIQKRARFLPPTVAPEDRMPTARRQYAEELQSIDEILSPGSIAALEVYATASQAPPEFRLHAKVSSCALIVIWTGARQ